MKQAIQIQLVQVEPRYNESRPRYQQHCKQKETIVVMSLRRNALLASLVFFICQFASVDTFNLLPTGILMYFVGVAGALEMVANWEHQADKEMRSILQREEEEFEMRYNSAIFEYQVLKGKPHAQIIKMNDKGIYKLFAIH
jgi:hypothetical protein